MIDLIDISKSFGARQLFAKVNLRVRDRDRLGLVGPNGTGKTTLFRILMGEMSPDEGQVEGKKGIRIGYLPQELYPSTAMDLSLHQYCIRQVKGVGALQDELAAIMARVEGGEHGHELLHRLAEVQELLHHKDADALPNKAKSVLLGLGFEQRDLSRPLKTMSGGLLMRAELARLLLDEPDLLLLDEPTNHLDLEGLRWFEEYLKAFLGAVVMIAHDREFLNRTVDRVVEVSPNGATDYGGDPKLPVYDRYVEERAKAIELAWKKYDEQQALIKELEDFIVKNRSNAATAARAQSRVKTLERLERLYPPEAVRKVKISFPQPPRSADLVCSLEGVTRRYGSKTVFQGLDLRAHRGERLAIVGINGAGKSSMLRLVAGVAEPDAGHRLLADGVKVGYFAQDQYEVLDPERTLHQHMLEVADTQTTPYVRPVLGAFLFGEDDLDKKAVMLSGGEKARLLLARMLLQPFGLLVMDEPTNHLDIASREVLEQALKEHQGTIVFTSHDRRFMDTLATSVIELKDGKLTRYPGNYSYYISKVGDPFAKEPEPTPQASKTSERELEKDRKREEAERRNRLYRILKPLKDRVSAVEEQIAKLEEELAEIDDKLVQPSLYEDPAKARELGALARELRAELDVAYDEWSMAAEELSMAELEHSET